MVLNEPRQTGQTRKGFGRLWTGAERIVWALLGFESFLESAYVDLLSRQCFHCDHSQIIIGYLVFLSSVFPFRVALGLSVVGLTTAWLCVPYKFLVERSTTLEGLSSPKHTSIQPVGLCRCGLPPDSVAGKRHQLMSMRSREYAFLCSTRVDRGQCVMTKTGRGSCPLESDTTSGSVFQQQSYILVDKLHQFRHTSSDVCRSIQQF